MNACCHHLIARTAARLPGKTALVCEGVSLSYAALEARARAVALRLRAGGLKTGDIAPVLLPRGLDAVAALLGVWKAGGAPCFLSEDYPPERVVFIRAACGGGPLLDRRWLEGLEADGAEEQALLPEELGAAAPDDTGLVVFTSGSTGAPKGVALPRRALSLAAQGNAAMLEEADIHLATVSFSFIAIMLDIAAPLVAGATLHIADEAARKDVALLERYVREHGVTTAFLPPQMARPFLAVADGTLRRLFTGSERVQRLWSAGTSVVNLYGSSETCGPVTRFFVDGPYDNTPVGTPYPGSAVHVLDGEGRPAPQGETGEICVSGQIATGYLNSRDSGPESRPEPSVQPDSDRFGPNPFATGKDDAALFHTGDLGRLLPDGTLQYVQRKDWMLKVRGFRVEPGEIEAAMLRSAPLDKAVVTGFQDSVGETRLYACYTAAGKVDPEAVREAMAAFLPDYMLPAFLEQVESLPLNANGKVDRKRIAPPDVERYKAEYAPPGNAVERALCDAFAAVLGAGRVGLDDDFILLGGDSIAAVRLQTALAGMEQGRGTRAEPEAGRESGLALSAAAILGGRTPRKLARFLGGEDEGADDAASGRTTRRTDGHEASGHRAGRTDGPIPEAAPREEWPLTFAERQMAIEQLLKPDSVEYNVNLVFSISGPLDADRLERALAALVAGHRVLRSRYLARPDGLVRVLGEPSAALARRACPPDAVTAAIEAADTPFRLDEGPLYRFALYSAGPSYAILHLAFHHAIIDGLSGGVLLADLWSLYEAAGTGEPELAPRRPDYLDYAVRLGMRDEDRAGLDFFREMFKEGAPENDMPTRPSRPESLPVPDAAVTASVRLRPVASFAARMGVTPYTALMAALGLTLAKYCGSMDVVLGAAMNGRSHPQTGGMVGMFVNTVPVRLSFNAGDSLHAFVRRAGQTLDAVRGYQDCPFESLVRALAPERDESRYPLFDLMVNYLDTSTTLGTSGAAEASGAASGLSIRALPIRPQNIAVDLVVEMLREGDELSVRFAYARRLYEDAVVEGMLEHFRAVLDRMASGGDMSVLDAAELTDAQRREILEAFAGERRDDNTGKTVVDAIRERAARVPDKDAVVFMGQSLTYAELDRLTDRIARAVAQRGVKRGEAVGVLVRRGLMLAAGPLGVLKAGAAYLPLDPGYPPERLGYMLQDSGVGLIIADADLAGYVPAFTGGILTTAELEASPASAPVSGLSSGLLSGGVTGRDTDVLDGPLPEPSLPDSPLPDSPSPDDLFVLFYTSGTTGKPKGVMVSHRNMMNAFRWHIRHFGLSDADAVTAYFSCGFDPSTTELFPPLMAGAVIHVIPEDMRLDLPALNGYYNERGVTVAGLPAQMGRQFIETMDNRSLRALYVGGESLGLAVLPQGYTVHNEYGPTECTILVTVFAVDRLYDRIPLGRAVDNTSLYIVDDNGRLAPVGAAGELCVAGRQVAMGYLNQPGATAERFTSNPFSADPDYARMYRTGDIARMLPGGILDFIGRRDFQVKIRGFRVELTEIEGRIRQFPSVADAAVVPGDAPGGGKCAVVYVVPADPDHPVDVPGLNRFIEELLPPYMVPAATVQVGRIPLNANGKVDRKRLPPPEMEWSKTGYTAPANETERMLCEAFGSLLGVDRVGAEDDFILLGGSSIAAVRLQTRLADLGLTVLGLAGLGLTAADILAARTPRALARKIAAEAPGAGVSGTAGSGTGDFGGYDAGGLRTGGHIPVAAPRDEWPLTFAERQMVTEQSLEPESVAYNVSMAFSLTGKLDEKRFERALAALVARHRVLRSYYPLRAGEFVRKLDDAPAALRRVTCPDDAVEGEIAAMNTPFDLTRPPLYRFTLFTVGDGEYVFHMNVHHSVLDGMSGVILFADLSRLYAGEGDGTDDAAGPDGGGESPATQGLDGAQKSPVAPGLSATPGLADYLDYAVWRESRGGSEAGEAYFLDMFAGGLPENDMPTKPRRPERLPFADAAQNARIALAPLERAAVKLGVTPYTLIMAATALTLAKYCGGEDVALGAVMNGRAHPDTAGMAGMFVNSLPVRLKPLGDMALHEFVRQTGTILDEVRARQDCPFERLVPRLAPDRNASRGPVFDLLLNYIEDMPLPDMPGLAVRPLPATVRIQSVDLALNVIREGNELAAMLSYSRQLYDDAVITGMLELFTAVLERLAGGFDMPLADACELPDNQRKQLLEDFAGERHDDALGRTVVDAFRERAALAPDRPAIAYNGERLSYRELDALTDRLAGAVAAAAGGMAAGTAVPAISTTTSTGTARGGAVGVLARRGVMLAAGPLAVFKAGAAYVPLDPSYPSDRLEYMLEDSGAALLIADSDLLHLVPGFKGVVLSTEAGAAWRSGSGYAPGDGPGGDAVSREAVTGASGDAFGPLPLPGDLAVLLYTSGTTGRPKGVMLSHANLANFCAWYARHYGLTEDDAVAAYASCGFDAALMDVFPAITRGARVQVVPEAMRLDLPGLNDLFERAGVTLAFLTTQLGRQFAESVPNHSLRALSIGGEALVPLAPPEDYALYNVYGPTECTIFTTAFKIDRLHDRVPLGRPLDNTRLYILDKRDRLAPVGAAGELCVAGRQVAMGYLNRPDLSAEKFVPNPFSGDPEYGRMYRTGDVARMLPDGTLDFTGRRDFQVKIRGFRVELTEIEGRIREYPGIADAAVVVADAPGGGKCAVAYVVASEPGRTVDPAGVGRFIEEKLPSYMVPASLMQVERIPLNPNGKVDRKKLPAPRFGDDAAGRQAGAGSPQDGGAFKTELEAIIAEVLGGVLGHTDFDLGTNLLRAGLASLSAIKLAAKLDERLGAAPPVRDILRDPTVLGLENAIVRSLLAARQSADMRDGAMTGDGAAGEGAGPGGSSSGGLSSGRAASGASPSGGVSPGIPSSDGLFPEGGTSGTERQEYPLSQNQAGVCYDCLKRPEAIVYNIPLRVNFSSALDAERLARAVAAVFDAHPAVKAHLAERNGVFVQALDDVPAVVPCRAMSEAERDDFEASFVRPFSLFEGPLYRAEVARAPDGVSLFLDVHHLVFDGGSVDLFLRDLGEAYERDAPFARGRERLSAFDWALLEARREGGEDWREDREYFASMLAGFERASEIPADLPHGAMPGRLAEAVRPVDGAAVEGFCREHGLTAAGLFLAATAYAVSRWTQNDDAYLATISSGRGDVRLANTFGMFVRTLPLKLSLGREMRGVGAAAPDAQTHEPSGQTRLEYARAAGEALGEAVAREQYPFTRIAEEFGFEPAIMYAFEMGVTAEYGVGGHRAELVPSMAVPDPKFKLSVHVEERNGVPAFAVQYDDALYSRDLMERFAETLAVALGEIMNRPGAPVRSVPLLAPGQEAALAAFNPPCEPVPEGVLHRMFEEAARRFAEHTALIAAEGAYTYARLNAEANRLAHGLIASGVAPEDRVAFALHRTGRVLIAMLGALKAGCAYIPIDPEYPAERIAHVLEDSGARFLLTAPGEDDVAERVAGMPGVLDMDVLREGRDEANPDLPVRPDHLAYLIYTSGSTGKPKGVMIEHGGIANYVTAHPRNPHVASLVADASVMLSITTVAFDMFLKESMTALCGGLTLVFADDDESRDPVRMAELFARTGADAFNTTPSRMLEYAAYPELLAAFRRCRVIMAGAENYPAALLSRLRGDGGVAGASGGDAGGALGAGAAGESGDAFTGRLFNTYGPTEITVSCNCKELTGADRITVGPPLLNVHEFIVDADGNLLPQGMAGELLVGGAGVARGYNNLPEQTAERFITYRGERVYKTGDLARWTKEGEVSILGRNDDQIKLRGLRIELGEIAGALAAIPSVRACAAAVRTLGGEEHICVWYDAEEALEPAAVRERLALTLPPYMLPSAYRQIDAMPKLPNGKNDVRSLPTPEPLRLAEYEAPQGALEEAFCEVFAAVLGLETVGACDSFFTIGGSSLAVTRVVIEAKRRGLGGGKGVSYGDVFANPTPRELAALIERGGAATEGAGAGGSGVQEDGYDYGPIHALLAEGTLDAFRQGEQRPLGNVLLTGATGFLGSHVLHALLTGGASGAVCCLLRKGRYDSVEQRLKNILYYYFEDAFEDLWGTRLFAVEGDITDSALADAPLPGGFAVDTVINCAANVSHFARDTGISDVNLGGVKNLITLARRENARLAHISTISVAGFSIDDAPPRDTLLTENLLVIGQSLENQYVHSKFMAERAILEAATQGLDAKIMRVGNLMARNRDGEFQVNLRSNSFTGRLRAYCAIGCFPYSSYLHQTELAPIDSTAKAVLLLAAAPGQCRVFHPYNNHMLFVGDIITAMRDEGIRIDMVEDADFEKAMAEAMKDKTKSERLVSLIAYQNIAQGKVVVPLGVASGYTSQALLRNGWQWPRTGDDYVRGFIRGLHGLGFFD